MRMLMCIPSVSELVAKALLKHFGTLANLQSALVDISTFPRVHLRAFVCRRKAFEDFARISRERVNLCCPNLYDAETVGSRHRRVQWPTTQMVSIAPSVSKRSRGLSTSVRTDTSYVARA